MKQLGTVEEDFGHLFTLKEWIDSVKCGALINYDGVGYYSDGKVIFDKEVMPSDLFIEQVDKSFSHIMWYNR